MKRLLISLLAFAALGLSAVAQDYAAHVTTRQIVGL